MSVENKIKQKSFKGTIIAIGTLAIGGGLAPLLLDYFSNDQPLSHNENIVREVEPQPIPVILKDVPPAQPIKKKELVLNKTTKSDYHKPQRKPALPTLQESDPFILQKIALTTEKNLFKPVGIINNFVVFIDNFSHGEVIGHFSPLVKPQGAFSVRKKNGVLTIDSNSYRRYDSYAHAVNSIDVDNFISFYTLLSPLIDQAYQEIGYPEGSFNSTFEKALDDILQTPIIHYKLELISPSVMYQYADKNLESLPDTQKLMLRMGPDNLQIVQKKLRKIKNELQRL